jgi:outer membrane biosynthesis protein TonB
VNSDLLAQTQVTVLRLAVNAKGEVEHVLIESTSGKSEIDLLGVEAARRLRFLPTAQMPLQWGRVTIFWKFVAAAPDTKTGATP